MGCHTWFYNKVSEMPQKDIETLKEISLSNINSSKILSCTYDEWVENVVNWKLEPDVIKKFIQKDFYDNRIKHLNWAKSIIEAKDMDLDSLVTIFKEFGGIVYDDYYDLSDCGWCDSYRVYGYPVDKFDNAASAIKFLEEYDQDKIKYGNKTGMCKEIKDIIVDFFNNYPNGYIEYG